MKMPAIPLDGRFHLIEVVIQMIQGVLFDLPRQRPKFIRIRKFPEPLLPCDILPHDGVINGVFQPLIPGGGGGGVFENEFGSGFDGHGEVVSIGQRPGTVPLIFRSGVMASHVLSATILPRSQGGLRTWPRPTSLSRTISSCLRQSSCIIPFSDPSANSTSSSGVFSVVIIP